MEKVAEDLGKLSFHKFQVWFELGAGKDRWTFPIISSPVFGGWDVKLDVVCISIKIDLLNYLNSIV